VPGPPSAAGATQTADVSLRGAALDLFLGSRCAGCGSPGGALCGRCRSAFVPRPRPCWPEPPPGGLVGPPAVPPWAAGAYADPLRQLLVAYKDRDRATLAAPLGAALASVVEAALGATGRAAAVELVPVPSAAASVRRRGRDVVADLARVAASQLRRRGCDARTVPRLKPLRAVSDQSGLSAVERAVNVHGALGVRRLRPPRAAVLVVDDVLTTGATAAEAVRALLDADVAAVAVAVVAATPRRGSRGEPGSAVRPLSPLPSSG
jgi:predicted amidophosphoribosyltransferase